MDQLHVLGFTEFFERQLERWALLDAIAARIAAEHRGAYEVWTRDGAFRARLAGRLRRELGQEALPGTGDWTCLAGRPQPGDVAIIDRVFERRTVFARGAAGRQTRAQVVAANVDVVFAVCGLDPDFNVRRIERYLARIWAGGAEPVIVLNKADLCADPAARVLEVERRCPGVPVLATSATRGDGLAAVRARIAPGMTAALVGSSGAGKSTLVNALLGEERMATGAVRPRDGRGRHVTTRRQLVPLPGGGLVLDTPGMRELEVAGETGMDAAFEDIASLAAHCRFRDCRHESEPGCAVCEAVASGAIASDRLASWRKLQSEARAFELRHDEHLRRQAERRFGRLVSEAARLRRWKDGG